MSTLKYAAYGSSVALFGNTELASMAHQSGAWGAGGGLTSNVWDNTSLLYPEADILVNLGSITPIAGGYILIAFQWSIDGGSNYPDPQSAAGQAAGNTPNIGTPIFQQALVTGASAKILVFPSAKLRPGKAKILLVNQSGVALNAAGNSVTMYPVTFTIT